MSVIFKSIIKMGEDKQWFIELVDTVDGRVAKCNNLDEYSNAVEEFGTDYGGNIDEVRWSKDDNVSPHIMDEIREGMLKYKD